MNRPLDGVDKAMPNFELSEEQRRQIAVLCKEYSVCELSLFGSSVTGAFEPATSDLDFAVFRIARGSDPFV